MSALYLVTGFLGAGKTTFLKRFTRFFGGKEISIIVNEFGRENVDEALLSELNAQLHGITGGSIFCTCRLDQFEAALTQVMSENPDVIIVETSGLSDPTSVGRVLKRDVFSGIEYKGCICLTDATSLYKLYETARVIHKQLSAADIALLNKVDIAGPEALAKARTILLDYLEPEDIFETRYAELMPEGLARLEAIQAAPRPDGAVTADVALSALSIRIDDKMTPDRLRAYLTAIAEETYRMKGYVLLSDGSYLVDCVGERISICPAPGGLSQNNRITVLYGYGLKARTKAKDAAAAYPGEVLSVDPK